MSNTYLLAEYKDRELVKGLGARWDPERRQWYVPQGRDLAPFATWLPADKVKEPEKLWDASRETLPATAKGVSLSLLLAGVASAVANAYQNGQWVRAEVVKVNARGGHVYLELAERSPTGDVMAQVKAAIWAGTANRILPAFQQATGIVLAAGIKLLIRAKPTFSPQYGMSLVVDEIDHEYSLGDLEARKREIRLRLKQEGLFELNRQLPAPWDFNTVLVVSPENAAGLGDFQVEAQRLSRWKLCRFVVVHSRFQNEGAATEVRKTILASLANWPQQGHGLSPDAIVLIRGGGAVNDLAWLNDYDLARCICESPIPVLTGIGHERDSTVLDEVAHKSFDTPSKVIADIEQAIFNRANDAKTHFQSVSHAVEQTMLRVQQAMDSCQTEIRSGAQQALWSGRGQATQQFQGISHNSLIKLEQARHAVPTMMGEVTRLARQTLHDGLMSAERHHTELIVKAGQQVALARERADQLLGQTADAARRQLTDARSRSEATIREIAGQGPEKTLNRGFAVIRSESGATLTRVEAARNAVDLNIEFKDGELQAQVKTDKRNQK